MIDRLLRRLFLTLYRQPRLSAPTPREQQLSDELRREFSNLNGAASVNQTWTIHRRELHKLVAEADPRSFLRWKTIFDTMFVDYAPYVPLELARLKREWKRWKPVIKEDKIGCPVPYYLMPSSSANAITHAFHLATLEEIVGVRVEDMASVFEFGGGYGSMCRLVRRLGFKGLYTIFDLPEFSALQRYYLQSIGLDASCVSKIESIKAGEHPSLFIATWSLSETPLELRERLMPIIRTFDYFLIGYQETFGGIDNVTFFQHLQREIPRRWKDWRVAHLPDGNRYLIGLPTNH